MWRGRRVTKDGRSSVLTGFGSSVTSGNNGTKKYYKAANVMS